MIYRKIGIIGFAAVMFSNCLAQAYDATIYWNDVKQTIRGFGACANFNSPQSMPEPNRSNSVAALFDTVTGAGLSMIRLEIRPEYEPSPGVWNWSATGSEGRQIWLVNEAKKKGVTFFWAAPWSPPTWMKSKNSTHGDAYLLASHYQDFADYLSMYVREYKSRYGITISGVSVQNEPHFASPWDGCPYSGTQLRDIIKNNIGPTFKRDSVNALIIAPESNWHLRSWADPIFSDTAASRYTSVAAFHEYETSLTTPYPLAQNQGKELWQTEVSNMGGDNPGISDAMGWAKLIHGHLTQAQVNAWHYWWFYTGGGSGEGLINTANGNFTTTKRLWVMGNYSKFVRPGWKMIRATYYTPDTLVGVSAFKNETTGKFAIIAVNFDRSMTQDLAMNLDGFSATTVIPWLTDETHDLKAQNTITIANGSFTSTLPAYSVTTFTGTGSTLPVTNVKVDSFVVKPAAIIPGQSSTLIWGTTNAITVTMDQGIAAPASAGSAMVTPTQTTTYTLTAEGPGGSVVRRVTLLVVVPREPEYPSPVMNGVAYKYYEGNWPTIPNYSALTPKLAGTALNFGASISGGLLDYYGIRWDAYVDIQKDGMYTFTTSSDDGDKLWIGNTLVVNNEAAHAAQERSGKIALKAGLHAITEEYVELAGAQSLLVKWECASAGIAKQLVPANRLFIIGNPQSIAPESRPCNKLNVIDSPVKVFDIHGRLMRHPIHIKNIPVSSGVVLICNKSNSIKTKEVIVGKRVF